MEALLDRRVVIGLAVVGGVLSALASVLQVRGTLGERAAKNLGYAGYAFMGASMLLFAYRGAGVSAIIIGGNAIAREVRAEWKLRADRLNALGSPPGLAVIMVGENRLKGLHQQQAQGFGRDGHPLAEDPLPGGYARVAGARADRGAERRPHLPRHPGAVLETISPDEDVDGSSRRSRAAWAR